MSENEFWKVMDKNFTKLVLLIDTMVDVQEHCSDPEYFKKLLDEDFDINFKVPSNCSFGKGTNGCTIFQLTNDPILSQILIDHGADYTITDDRGLTKLLKEANAGYKQYLSYLKLGYFGSKLFDNVTLSAHINLQNPKNPQDRNGLSHFHIACMCNRADVAKFFLENGESINETVQGDSTFYPGFSALHFAAMSWAFETVELLLKLGADVFAKDSRGMNPLHVLIVDRREIFCILNRITSETLSDKEKSKFSKLFDCYSKSEKIIYLLLDTMKELGCCLDNDTGLSYFHVLCFLGNTSSIKEFLHDNREYLTQSVNRDSPICPGYTPLHFAAHSNVETVELLVKSGANISAKDVDGVTPLDICLKEFSVADVHRIFVQEAVYSSIVFSDGKTKLSDFMQSMQEDITFESFLKNNLTDPNMFIPFQSPLFAGYTPLHLTIVSTGQPMSWGSAKSDYIYRLSANAKSEISQTYLSRIDSCLRCNPDVTRKDAQGSTPIHWAFRLQQIQAVRVLLERHEANIDCVNEHGLSHLHIACAAKNENMIAKLLSGGGANVNAVATSSYVWTEVDMSAGYFYFVKYVKMSTHFALKGSTPLHFAVSARCVKSVEILINHGADVLAKDDDGLNPLERIFGKSIFRDYELIRHLPCSLNCENTIPELLIRKVGDRLAATKPNQMLYCYSLLEDDLLCGILSHADDSTMKILKVVGITALHVACFTQKLERVRELLVNDVDVNARANFESPLWPGCTPLHLFTRETPSSEFHIVVFVPSEAILDELLRNGADVAVVNAKGETPICQMFRHHGHSDHEKHVEKLLKFLKDFSVNSACTDGYTHLHIASACGDVTAVEQLLEHGAMIEQPTDYFSYDADGNTALHVAVRYLQKDVVEVLLKRGADVNRRNARDQNSLHVAAETFAQNFQLLETLIRAGADVCARDVFGRTPLEIVVMRALFDTKEKIKLFLACGIRVNTVNPMNGQGLLALALDRYRELFIFEMFVKAPDVKDMDDHERNAIHNAVSIEHTEFELLQAMRHREFASSEDYIRAIDLLIKLGLDIDHQDCNGSTPLHVAAQMKNHTGIVGLLDNGAEIDIVNDNGKSAFACSLELAELHEKPNALDLIILGIILIHTYKLHLAGIGISRSNKEIYVKVGQKISLDLSKVEECNNEVERMRTEEMTPSSVKLYEFLSDTGAVGAFPYMLPCIQAAICSYFKDEINNLREKFPHLTGILLLQYRKALARGDLIYRATTSLNFLVGFDMPVICSRIIFRFFSNVELNNLIISTADE